MFFFTLITKFKKLALRKLVPVTRLWPRLEPPSLFSPGLQLCPSTHLSRLSLWANILQSLPLVCGASRLPHNFCRIETGMRKAFGPTSVVMLLAGSNRDVSMLWESCTKRTRVDEGDVQTVAVAFRLQM